MRSRIRKISILSNIIILLVMFIIIIGIYINVKNSKAKETTKQIATKFLDLDETAGMKEDIAKVNEEIFFSSNENTIYRKTQSTMLTINNEDIEFTSVKYQIDMKNSEYIKGVEAHTSVIEFLMNIKTNAEFVRIFDNNGKELKTENGIVGTGMKVYLNEGEETQKILEIVVPGDLNGDGKIKASDLSILKSSMVGRRTLEGAYKEAADMSEDGMIKASDLSRMKKILIGQ